MSFIAGVFSFFGNLPSWVRVGLLLIAVHTVSFLMGERQGIATAEALHAQQTAGQSVAVASAVVQHVAVVRKSEASAAASQYVIASKYQQDIQNEIQKRDRLIADLRAGRLRQPTSCTGNRDHQPTTSAIGPSNHGDPRSEFYRSDYSSIESEELIRIGSDANQIVYQLAACQAQAINDRALINHD